MSYLSTRDQLPAHDGALSKLEVQEGDVLVLRAEVRYAEQVQDMAIRLKDSITDRGLTNVLILLLGEGASIESLDEAAMKEYGWVRASVPAPAVDVDVPGPGEDGV